jgi:uncharacterized protein YeeX (DUF496 family)
MHKVYDLDYENGQAIVSNQEGDLNRFDYTDKIDDVLIQDNLIETIEKELKESEKSLKDAKNEKKNDNRNCGFINSNFCYARNTNSNNV